MYFWENNDQRAYEWAIEESKKTGSRVKKPAVLGAVITLGNCLDLLDHKNLNIVRESYEYFMELCTATNSKAPENRKPASADGNDKFIRNLDCSVIQYTHSVYSDENRRFDSVRGMFIEGEELYHGAGFRAKDHIEIAVRNPNCIKGYFLPKKLNNTYKRV